MISNKKDSNFLYTNIKVAIIIPIKAPWKDIPPSQILKISIGFKNNNLNYRKLHNQFFHQELLQ